MIALAVDAGGTSTRSVVVDGNGACLGYGRGGSGNPVSAGVALAADSVADSIRYALATAGVAAGKVGTLLVAMAGGVPEEDVGRFREPLRALGIEAPPVFRGDALATFCSGTWRESGYALIVGTGAVAIRVEAGEVVATSDGLGWLLGDDGSGFWIGHRVVRAALAALEKRGPATNLTELFLAEVAGADASGRMREGRPHAIAAALETLYRARPVELARFARLAFRASPDPVADAIVSEAASALVVTLEAVLAAGPPGPVVLGGGILSHNPALAELVTSRLPSGVASRVRGVQDGLAGAAVLALRAGGRQVDEGVARRIVQSLGALRGVASTGYENSLQ